ncbi:MAG: hypothetical protein ACJ74U_19205 [Jatrophihabitantaceae bacterium]
MSHSEDLPAGLRYLIEHGHAADGSHSDNTESTQGLVNPPHHNPTASDSVHRWMKQRAAADHQMQAAARARA